VRETALGETFETTNISKVKKSLELEISLRDTVDKLRDGIHEKE
jgi:hypothetical protein